MIEYCQQRVLILTVTMIAAYDGVIMSQWRAGKRQEQDSGGERRKKREEGSITCTIL